MKLRLRAPSAPAFLTALLALHGAPALASTDLSGAVFDGSGGPLLAGEVYRVTNHIGVPSGQTLTIEAGAIVKFEYGLHFDISGTLDCEGTAADPVVFTGIEDDSVGGDTNGGGPSAAVPGAWRGLLFRDTSDASELEWVEVRYGGASNYSGIWLMSADIALRDSTIRDCSGSGLYLSGNTFGATVTDCNIEDNGGTAIYDVPLSGLEGFSGISASGNGGAGDVTWVASSASILGTTTIGPDNYPGEALVVANHIGVSSGASLTLEAGTIIKLWASYHVDVNGTLTCNGTPASPVVFTDYADDSHGGDTNGDGPSTGGPGAWRGISFTANADASALHHTVVRHGGASFYPGFRLFAADVELIGCRVEEFSFNGLELSGNTYGATVRDCTFTDNQGTAISNVPIEGLAGFFGNSASGNWGNYVEAFGDTTVNQDATLTRDNLIDGVLLLSNHTSVASGATWTVERGVVLKWSASFQFGVAGGLNLNGTAFEPVVLTSWHDDDHGGDTNNNGAATAPAPGNWRGLVLQSSTTPSSLENVLLRYGGASFYPGVRCQSPLAKLRAVRVEHFAHIGFELQAHASTTDSDFPMNLVAFDCASDGFSLQGGSFALVHATSTGNGGWGITAFAAYSGVVANSISWANGSGNFAGLGQGDVYACDGHPTLNGMDGNIFADPAFVDPSPAVGDLRPSAGALVIGTGSAAWGDVAFKDHDENPRTLPFGQQAQLLPDMGAYERGDWTMSVTGEPRPNTLMSFTVTGVPGAFSLFVLGFLDGVTPTAYGYSLAGVGTTTFLLTLPLGTPLVVPVPDVPVLTGLEFGIQTLTYLPGPPAVGSTTNLYRGRLLPAG